jgi:hypothetical protein
MYCINCGQQLPDGAKFCSGCGAQQQVGTLDKSTPSSPSSNPQVQWETIEIEAREEGVEVGRSLMNNLLGGSVVIRCHFVGRRVTPLGEQVVNIMEFLKTNTRPLEAPSSADRINAQQALNQANDFLLKDGWQPDSTRGQFWYSYRYRRQWNPERQTENEVTRAIRFLVYLRKAGIHLKPTTDGKFEVIGGRLSPEAIANTNQLKVELQKLLEPGNDRAAAFILLEFLRDRGLDLMPTQSGDLQVLHGHLDKESAADAKRLKPQLLEILQEREAKR